MIHSDRPTFLPVANIAITRNLFCFAILRTDVLHVWKQLSIPAVTMDKPSGSISGIPEPEYKNYSRPEYAEQESLIIMSSTNNCFSLCGPLDDVLGSWR